MLKQILPKALTLSVCCILASSGIQNCCAEESTMTIPLQQGSVSSNEQVIDLSRPTQSVDNVKSVNLSENDAFYHLISASDRFVQCNIRAAWNDFRDLINSVEPNDFVYLSVAKKMSELGFFDLANLAISKISDKELASVPIDEMKRFYFPKKKLKLSDELFLAENYSNIMYNDQSAEAANELLKNTNLISTSDYANYLVALASYKSDFNENAMRHISMAITQNPYNLNYVRLKAKIIADSKTPQDALKVVEVLKHQNLASADYIRQIKSLEQYVMYKIAKKPWEKTYHLGYHYYLENDSSKAIRTLQSSLALSKRKYQQEMIYSLMSEIYLTLDEYEKAGDTAKKAHRLDSSDVKALITLGDLSYKNQNYKQALKYYKSASAHDKTAYKPLVNEAKTYQKLNELEKAEDLYKKVLKTHSDSYEAYYNVAMMQDENSQDRIVYLKKAIAVNLQYKEAWLELAKIEISRENFDIAQKYLSNAYYIDENDFRYYYYQGLLYKGLGETTKAIYNFKKCLKLNPNFTPAENVLEPTIK